MISSSVLSLALLGFPTALGAVWNVTVAPEGKLVYEPEWVNAAPGDFVQFTFNPKAHTVTQSTFDTPCVPVPGGATTGFVPVAAGASPQPIRIFQVPEGNTPLWFYCGQVGHCGQGMVFAINPPADPSPKSFSAFKALAIAQNGTTSTNTTSTPLTFSTPPPQSWATATATVTQGASTWTTTYTSYAGSPPPTPGAQVVDHKIEVGPDGSLIYNPASIQANVGDTVTFEFKAKNHTVTQSSFANPCQHLTRPDGTAGFASGFKPVDSGSTDFPTFQITINDTAPIWGYCGQTGHCGQGMVFAINAVESGPNNFANFQTIAMNTAGSPTGGSSSGGNSSTGNGDSDSGSSGKPKGGAVSAGLSVLAATFSVVGVVALMF